MEFNEKFKLNELEIIRYKNWTWSLRPKQTTFGSSIISYNKDEIALSSLSDDELIDYIKFVKRIEISIKKALKPEKINYLTLMMVDNRIHTHIIPRYKKNIIFLEKAYSDISWPNIPNMIESDLMLGSSCEQKLIKKLIKSFD